MGRHAVDNGPETFIYIDSFYLSLFFIIMKKLHCKRHLCCHVKAHFCLCKLEKQLLEQRIRQRERELGGSKKSSGSFLCAEFSSLKRSGIVKAEQS